MERLYRIATTHDDYRANLSLRGMILKVQTNSESLTDETLDLTERLIQQNLAGGYYDMATYIERGIVIEADTALALQYYRKSADMGSPEGQCYVSDQFSDLAPHHPGFEVEVAKRMLRCAADQEHQKATHEYDIKINLNKKPAEALRHYHLATKNGSPPAAPTLGDYVFPYTLPPSDPDYMGVTAAPERARRYK